MRRLPSIWNFPMLLEDTLHVWHVSREDPDESMSKILCLFDQFLYPRHPQTSREKFQKSTLPKTNIAMENPPFWWYLQGNMVIFMGYVSFREGNIISSNWTAWSVLNPALTCSWLMSWDTTNHQNHQIMPRCFQTTQHMNWGSPSFLSCYNKSTSTPNNHLKL